MFFPMLSNVSISYFLGFILAAEESERPPLPVSKSSYTCSRGFSFPSLPELTASRKIDDEPIEETEPS